MFDWCEENGYHILLKTDILAVYIVYCIRDCSNNWPTLINNVGYNLFRNVFKLEATPR